jgi:hypothetical protein
VGIVATARVALSTRVIHSDRHTGHWGTTASTNYDLGLQATEQTSSRDHVLSHGALAMCVPGILEYLPGCPAAGVGPDAVADLAACDACQQLAPALPCCLDQRVQHVGEGGQLGLHASNTQDVSPMCEHRG